MRRRLPFALILSTLLLFCIGCGRGSEHTVNVVGSTSVQPFANELALAFNERNAPIRVLVQGGGTTAGLVAVDKNIADIGTCSRALAESETQLYHAIQIARDGLAIVVNASNPVTNLTTEQIQQLFAGHITNWNQLPGGFDHPVTLVTREEGSGTHDAFLTLVMGNSRTQLAARALVLQSNGAVREVVANDPGGVGYMSLGMAGEEVKSVRINGIEPCCEEVRNGHYPFCRPFLFVVKGTPKPDAQKFIDFVLSREGQDTLEREGLARIK